jgi:hypothetical protein
MLKSAFPTSKFGTSPSSSIVYWPAFQFRSKMPSKKYKPTQKNTGPGDVLILSSTSYYTSRGLVEKTKVSKHASSPEKSPSKSPEKLTHGLTPHSRSGGAFDFDQAMLEPLKLPQSKVCHGLTVLCQIETRH